MIRIATPLGAVRADRRALHATLCPCPRYTPDESFAASPVLFRHDIWPARTS